MNIDIKIMPLIIIKISNLPTITFRIEKRNEYERSGLLAHYEKP